jgi:hypothetical protein
MPVKPRRSRWPGRLSLDDRGCLNASSLCWSPVCAAHRDLLSRPAQQLGSGSGMTCWRRLRDWTTAGVSDHLHALLLTELHAVDQIDWSGPLLMARTRVQEGDDAIDPGPVDRPVRQQALPPRRRSRHPARGHADQRQPQRHPQLLPLLDGIPPLRGKPGRPPAPAPMAWSHDRGYDHDKYRRLV